MGPRRNPKQIPNEAPKESPRNPQDIPKKSQSNPTGISRQLSGNSKEPQEIYRIRKTRARLNISDPYCDRNAKQVFFQGILWEGPWEDIAGGFREPPAIC